jgi:hypothetical protein
MRLTHRTVTKSVNRRVLVELKGLGGHVEEWSTFERKQRK